MNLRPRSFVVAGALAMWSFSACSLFGGDRIEPEPAKTQPPVPKPAPAKPAAEPTPTPGCGTGNIFDKLCVKKPEDLQNFRFDQVPAPYKDAAGCKAFDPLSPQERSCMCDSCFKLLQQCDALADCRTELKCIIESGCRNTEDCYLNNGPCRDVIDEIGNTSVATTIVQFLGQCAETNQCRVPKQ